MKKFNKKSVLLSSAVATGLIFAVGNPVKADTTSDTSSSETTTLQIKHNTVTPVKASISPVASRGGYTLRQVAKASNTSLATLESLNDNINPDTPIVDGTPLYLPQNSNVFEQENSKVPHNLYVKYWSHLSPASRAAKAWIAQRESGGNYKAVNPSSGTYGRYQLMPSYLHGNYSPANQERTANRYVKNRYGSWVNAKRFWLSHGWY